MSDDDQPFGLKRTTIAGIASAALLMVARDPIKRAVTWMGLGDDWAGALVGGAMFVGIWIAGLSAMKAVRRILSRLP